MKMKLLATVALVAFASPAFAAFYIVQDNNTKACSIVEQRPTDASTMVIGGDNKVYANRADAENDMRNAQACRSSTTGSSPGSATPGTPPSSPPSTPR